MSKKHQHLKSPPATDLEIVAEPVEPCQMRLVITVPPARVEREMTQVAQQYARRLKVPGYRPGKVPLKAVIAQVGEDELRGAARETMADQVVREAMRAESLVPYANPQLESLSDDPVSYTVLIPLAPQVELGDYLSLRVPEPETEPVTGDEVAAQLESWRNEVGQLEPVERAAAEGDTVIVTLVGRLGDEIVAEHEALTLQLNPEALAEAELPPALIEALVGMSPGDTATVPVSYSEFWSVTALQGQAVPFDLTVESVMTEVLPELDDAFAREISDAATLAELEERVRDNIIARRRLAARDQWVEDAITALVDQATIVYPPLLVEAEVDDAINDLHRRVERQGFTWERWLELQEKDEEALRDELAPGAEERLRRSLAVSELALVEHVQVERGEVEHELQRQDALLAGSGLRLKHNKDVRSRLGSELLIRHAINRLLEIVRGDADAAPTATPDELAAEAATA